LKCALSDIPCEACPKKPICEIYKALKDVEERCEWLEELDDYLESDEI